MDLKRQQQIETLFHQALALEPGKRISFLQEACQADEGLRREVETLLNDTSQVKEFLESSDRQEAIRNLAEHPALQPKPDWTGRILGSYRLDEKIGQGGMGVVYKAEDIHLGRRVAIKVLPPDLMIHEERRLRFLREAKAASSLQHPGIVTIFDINRSQGDGPDYIVMEYLAGKSLDQWIGPKGIAPRIAARIAIQIAEALSAAHAAGLVHRDLKPANIMVMESGPVKLLDFGLAKLMESESAQEPGQEENSGSGTAKGLIMGTPAYMSPEQAGGGKVDSRSDIFSFGSVLYEMLTGIRAFSGNNHLATLSAVLREEPKPVGSLVPDLPAQWEKIVHRCLRKDPARRFQHIADLKIELEELFPEEAAPVVHEKRAKPALRRLWPVAAVAFLVLSVLLFGYFFSSKPTASLPFATTTRLTSYLGYEDGPCFSPDGKQVVFAWSGAQQDNWDIYVKMLDADTPLRLTTSTAQDIAPAWSPDGRQIAFIRRQENQDSIWIIDPLGRTERKLTDESFLGCWISWSPDGKWLAVSRQESLQGANLLGEIFLIPVEGGQKRRITFNQAHADIYPAFSPDGKKLAYASYQSAVSGDLYVVELGMDYLPLNPARKITRNNVKIAGISWMPDSRELIYSASDQFNASYFLWRTGISSRNPPEKLQVLGQAVHPAVAPTGYRLAFRQSESSGDIWKWNRGKLDRNFISSTLHEDNPQFSPDEKKIAFGSNRIGGLYAIWVCDVDGSNPRQLTHGPGRMQGMPRWSPDSRWIVFDSLSERGQVDLFVIDAAGGTPRQLTFFASDESVPSWSGDGQWIYFRSNRTGQSEIWKIPSAGGEAVQITDQGGYVAFESWDAQFIFYTKDFGQGGPLFRKRLSGGKEEQVLSSVVNRAFCVTREGINHIASGENGQFLLLFFDFASGQEQLRLTLDSPPGMGMTATRDGQTLLFTGRQVVGSDLMLVENFR